MIVCPGNRFINHLKTYPLQNLIGITFLVLGILSIISSYEMKMGVLAQWGVEGQAMLIGGGGIIFFTQFCHPDKKHPQAEEIPYDLSRANIVLHPPIVQTQPQLCAERLASGRQWKNLSGPILVTITNFLPPESLATFGHISRASHELSMAMRLQGNWEAIFRQRHFDPPHTGEDALHPYYQYRALHQNHHNRQGIAASKK